MSESRPQLFGVLAGLFLAAGLVASAMLVSGAWLRIAESQTVTVTGSAHRGVQSDLIIWRGSISAEDTTLLGAQRHLKEAGVKMDAFLQERGVTNYQSSSIQIQEVRTRQKEDDGSMQQKITGYRLLQTVEVQTASQDLAMKLERESTVLVEQGILFTPQPTEYIYTKSGDTKVEMLAEATKDARARAEQIASQGGRKVDQLRSAKMGVFQITPLHSSQTSWEGMNDTSSFEKTVTSVITATFSMR